MTCPVDEKALLLPRMKVEDDVEKGVYVKLSEAQEESSGQEEEKEEEDEVKEVAATSPFWSWFKLALLFSFLAALAFVAYRWVGPLIMDKVCIFYSKTKCMSLIDGFP